MSANRHRKCPHCGASVHSDRLNDHLGRCPSVPVETRQGHPAISDYRHIFRVLQKKFGRIEAERLMDEARQVGRLSDKRIEDVLVETAGLQRGAEIDGKIKGIARKKAAQARLKKKGYRLVDGVKVYGGGAPGLKQQH